MPYTEAHLAQELNFQLRQDPVLSLITNQDYEGEITRPEDTVTITRPTGVTIRDYDPESDLQIEEMTGTDASLAMDHSKYFSFYAPKGKNLSAVADSFAEHEFGKLVDAAEEFVFSKYSQADSQVDVAGSASEADFVSAVRKANVELSKAGAPRAGRFLVVSGEEELKMLEVLSDRESPLGDAKTSSGYIGQLAGFSVFSRESVSAGTTYRHCLAGHTSAITWADAIAQIDIVRAEKRIGRRVAGLHIGGAAVVRPEALLDLRVDTSA